MKTRERRKKKKSNKKKFSDFYYISCVVSVLIRRSRSAYFMEA